MNRRGIAKIESKKKKKNRLKECQTNVDARDAKTKKNVEMSRRRKREKRLESGGRERMKKRERRGDIGVGQTEARRECTAPDVYVYASEGGSEEDEEEGEEEEEEEVVVVVVG